MPIKYSDRAKILWQKLEAARGLYLSKPTQANRRNGLRLYNQLNALGKQEGWITRGR